MSDLIPTKSRWIRPLSGGQVIRVMGTVEGWVVARYKGSAPFLIHQNDWSKRYIPAPPAVAREE